MRITINMLTDAVPSLNKKVSYAEIFKKWQIQHGEADQIIDDLIQYMKKKVRHFEYDDAGVIIMEYTKLDIKDLFKYFGLTFTNKEFENGSMKHILCDTLYGAWRFKDDYDKESFIRELNKYLSNFVGDNNYFIFNDELFIRPYRIKEVSSF